ncbi:MAG: hypothetical protein LAN71_13640 [Acidobacteriia bacterium]|nr:hypothetical protein [Terriglobia bacterium]
MKHKSHTNGVSLSPASPACERTCGAELAGVPAQKFPATASAEAGKTHAPAKPGPVSRTRGSGPQKRGKTPAHRGAARTGANGHGGACGANGEAAKKTGPAASDDARGTSAELSANSPAAVTARDAYAEVAGPRANGAGPRVPEEPARGGSEAEVAWMQDGVAFANALFARVNPLDVGERLLTSEDEKIAQRTFERMLEMKWGKPGGLVEELPPQIIWDLPGPKRD